MHHTYFPGFAAGSLEERHVSDADSFGFLVLPSCTSSRLTLFTVETLSQAVPKSSCDFIWLPQLNMLPLKNSSENKAGLTSTQTPHELTLALLNYFSVFLILTIFLLLTTTVKS